MARIHTRTKRRLGLSTHRTQYIHFHAVTKKHRPKTFSTSALAEGWATKQGMKSGSYTIKTAKRGKRFQIVKA